MSTELIALISHGTWILVSKSSNANGVGNKWIVKLKHKADGSVKLTDKSCWMKQGIKKKAANLQLLRGSHLPKQKGMQQQGTPRPPEKVEDYWISSRTEQLVHQNSAGKPT
ncbi:unnamed protein product [Dovyalis caffra]|uniref:Uncharacterized protein n=1 Tax=Dovyalis caffra TaxID=77055 RepID=A0AAV1R0H6_9ROSI|nr:unnamed protein product [Dovyalis caffra]